MFDHLGEEIAAWFLSGAAVFFAVRIVTDLILR
jgi:hypothetical protein